MGSGMDKIAGCVSLFSGLMLSRGHSKQDPPLSRNKQSINTALYLPELHFHEERQRISPLTSQGRPPAPQRDKRDRLTVVTVVLIPCGLTAGFFINGWGTDND